VLGDEQWAWLKAQLQLEADVRVVVSSIQVVAADHRFEKWANFPLQRKALFDLVAETKANGVVLLSGDRHRAELTVEKKDVPYAMYDLTSSSMNRPIGGNDKESRRIGEQFAKSNFGVVEIDWRAKEPKVTLQIRGEDGKVVLGHALKLSDLQVDSAK